MITIEEIKKALEKAIHPEFDKSLIEFGMIRDIKIEKNKIIIVLVLPFLHVPIREQLIKIIKEIIKENFSIIPNIEIEEMNHEEKRKFGEMVKQLRSPSL
jgi:ATP-binding protein involved in chromosome partitioning